MINSDYSAGNIVCRVLLGLVTVTFAACSGSGTWLTDWGRDTDTDRDRSLFVARCDKQLLLANEIKIELEDLESPYTLQKVLKPFNQLEMLVGDLYGEAQLFETVQPSQRFRHAASECKQQVAVFSSNMTLSKGLYQVISSVGLSSANNATRRYVEITLSNFRLAGVDQKLQVRNRIQMLNHELEILEQEFQRNIREDVHYLTLNGMHDLAGLPDDYIAAHAANDGGVIQISTRYPDYLPFMTYAESDTHRKTLAKLYQNRAWPANRLVLEQLLDKRYELAQVLGYGQYADYARANKMTASADKVEKFIDDLAFYVQPVAESEYQQLLERKQRLDPMAKRIGIWEKSFLSEQIRRENFGLNSAEVREYFSYAASRDGIFALVDRLFGLTIRPWETSVWHSNVEAYELLDGQKVIGRFYLDMHSRDGKYGYAAHFPVKSGVAGRQLPVSALVANLGINDDPEARLEHSEVQTFAHEFGHLLHHQLSSHYEWAALTGAQWNFVEAPAMMLEQWVWNRQFLKSFARNAQGELIPDHLIEQMNAARRFGRGLHVQSQLYYAALSLNYHNDNPENINLDKMMGQLAEQYTQFKTVPDGHFYASFGHLIAGYPAIYHTYLWSFAIALDMYAEFEREGLFDSHVADRYRQMILSAGGIEPANALIERFLQRPFSLKAFYRYMNKQ